MTLSDEKGLTFVEIMVAVAILAFLFTAIFGLLETGMTLFAKSDAHLDQVQNMRVAMETLARDLRKAEQVSFNSAAKVLVITFPGGSETYGLGTEAIYGPSGLRGKKLWRATASNPIASYLADFEVIVNANLAEVTLKAITPEDKIILLKNSFTLRNKK